MKHWKHLDPENKPLHMTDEIGPKNNRLSLPDELDHQWTTTWVEEIPSDPIHGVNIIRQMLEELENQLWPEKDRFGIHMALEEAIMNAIKHGNCCDGTKCVTIDARLSATKFYINVKDEGPGFDPHAVPDPTLDENLTKPSGRGLMLMRIYMNEVQYSENGTRVELLKIRSAQN